MKHEGHSGWEAWRAFFDEARDEERRAIHRKAIARKVEIGLWEERVDDYWIGEAGPVSYARPKRGPGVPSEWRQRQDQVQALVREREMMALRRRVERQEQQEWLQQQQQTGGEEEEEVEGGRLLGGELEEADDDDKEGGIPMLE